MKNRNKYALLGLKALQRAAGKAVDDARKNNLKIPIWKNGRIEYEMPVVRKKENSKSGDDSVSNFNRR